MSHSSIDLYSMKQDEEEVLREQKPFILKNVVLDAYFLAECTARKVFARHFVEDELQSIASKTEKVTKILEYIPKRGPDAFPKFLEFLEKSGQHHVADRLKQKLKEKQQEKEKKASRSQVMCTSPDIIGATDLPTVIKKKFLDVYKKIRKHLEESSVTFEDHSLSTIKFDHVEAVVDEMITSFSWLWNTYSLCQEKLEKAMLSMGVMDGVDYLIKACEDRKEESIKLKQEIESLYREKVVLAKEVSLYKYEVKLLKERELRHLQEKSALESKVELLNREAEDTVDKNQDPENPEPARSSERMSNCVIPNSEKTNDSEIKPDQEQELLFMVQPSETNLWNKQESENNGSIFFGKEVQVASKAKIPPRDEIVQTNPQDEKKEVSEFIKIYGKKRRNGTDICKTKEYNRKPKQNDNNSTIASYKTATGLYDSNGNICPVLKLKNRDSTNGIYERKQTFSFLSNGSQKKNRNDKRGKICRK